MLYLGVLFGGRNYLMGSLQMTSWMFCWQKSKQVDLLILVELNILMDKYCSIFVMHMNLPMIFFLKNYTCIAH